MEQPKSFKHEFLVPDMVDIFLVWSVLRPVRMICAAQLSHVQVRTCAGACPSLTCDCLVLQTLISAQIVARLKTRKRLRVSGAVVLVFLQDF